jgi:hypothetical protein
MSMDQFHFPEEALAVETYVERIRGQWEVSVAVIFADEVVRKSISTYHTERQANIAASWIKRAAERNAPLARPENVPHSNNEEPTDD